MEGERKPESIGEGGNGKHRLTGDAIGVASMEEYRNPLNIFVVEQQKSEDLLCKKKPFGCMLFNYFNIYFYNV